MFCVKNFHKTCKIHRETTVLQPRLNKVVTLRASNFIEKRLEDSCFPVNFAKFLRTLILLNFQENFCRISTTPAPKFFLVCSTLLGKVILPATRKNIQRF